MMPAKKMKNMSQIICITFTLLCYTRWLRKIYIRFTRNEKDEGGAVVNGHYMYFFFLDELRNFTISDFPKQTHDLVYTLITLFFSYTLKSIHTSPKCFCAGCTSSGHWLKNNVKVWID